MGRKRDTYSAIWQECDHHGLRARHRRADTESLRREWCECLGLLPHSRAGVPSLNIAIGREEWGLHHSDGIRPTDAAQVKSALKSIQASKLPVDVLVNNAGITYNSLFQMTSIDRMRSVFDVNFFAQAAFTQYIVRMMVRQNSGVIVNISSTAALDANPGRAAYGASKAALICLTRVMAHELADHNIRVNAIAPGLTDTDMVKASMSNEMIDAAVQQTRLKRIGQPSEISAAAVFLASDLSSYITGEVLRVDGGLQN